MYVKLTKLDRDRAMYVTAFGHTIDTRRSLFPASAAVGDAYTITLNADADGLDVVPICDKAWRRQRRKVEEIREMRRKKNGNPIHRNIQP
jgi:hypothetical protein